MADAAILEKKQHVGSGLGRGKAPMSGGGGPKRHLRKERLRDNILGVTAPAIRRLARRGGIKRIDGKIYEATRQVLKDWLTKVTRDAITYTEYARRKTVTHMDVILAVKKHRITLYLTHPNGSDGGGHKSTSSAKQIKNNAAAPAVDDVAVAAAASATSTA